MLHLCFITFKLLYYLFLELSLYLLMLFALIIGGLYFLYNGEKNEEYVIIIIKSYS